MTDIKQAVRSTDDLIVAAEGIRGVGHLFTDKDLSSGEAESLGWALVAMARSIQDLTNGVKEYLDRVELEARTEGE